MCLCHPAWDEQRWELSLCQSCPEPKRRLMEQGSRQQGRAVPHVARSLEFPLTLAPKLQAAWIWQPSPSQCGPGFCCPLQSSINQRLDLILTRGRRLGKEPQLREVKVKHQGKFLIEQ